jgi:hypothetical protein
VTGRRGGRPKRLFNGLKRGRRYLKLNEDSLERFRWRTRFERSYGPVVRQIKEWIIKHTVQKVIKVGI